MNLEFQKFSGPEVQKIIPDLSALRIKIFREFPYLYDGDLEYEKKYLNTYVKSSRSLVVLAYVDHKVVGATTCLPLHDEEIALQGNFAAKGYDIQKIFYFGESILLKECRSLGVGAKFFDFREEHARSFQVYDYASFCAVVRPLSHPNRPTDYRSPESLWHRRGYQIANGIRAQYSWKDIGDKTETYKEMQFWIKKFERI